MWISEGNLGTLLTHNCSFCLCFSLCKLKLTTLQMIIHCLSGGWSALSWRSPCSWWFCSWVAPDLPVRELSSHHVWPSSWVTLKDCGREFKRSVVVDKWLIWPYGTMGKVQSRSGDLCSSPRYGPCPRCMNLLPIQKWKNINRNVYLENWKLKML